jgi:probable HAF family extracellular repeat protein
MRPIRLGTAILRAALVVSLSLLLVTTAATPAGARGDEPTEYVITELGSLGGTDAAGISISNRGLIAGYSRLPGDAVVHATVWRNGSAVDLGTLGGPGTNSAVLWPNYNNRGIVVGVAETDELDPLGELWSCSAFFPTETGHVCRGFVWERGEMRALPTHGGTHGFAVTANNRGQVVGWAETAERDPTCAGPEGRDQVLGFVGALWDTRDGDRIHELPPLPGTNDTASTGNAINDRGQVAGISGICDQAVGRFSARHMALWENGVPTEIESFGAEAWNTPMAINSKGVVVGFANAAGTKGGDFNERPFQWTKKGGIQDLGTLDGHTRGQALGVNNRGQVVGLSREADGGGVTAVIWQNGEVADLNSLAPGYEGHLLFANDINDAGVLTGEAISAETGGGVAFTATPVKG